MHLSRSSQFQKPQLQLVKQAPSATKPIASQNHPEVAKLLDGLDAHDIFGDYDPPSLCASEKSRCPSTSSTVPHTVLGKSVQGTHDVSNGVNKTSVSAARPASMSQTENFSYFANPAVPLPAADGNRAKGHQAVLDQPPGLQSASKPLSHGNSAVNTPTLANGIFQQKAPLPGRSAVFPFASGDPKAAAGSVSATSAPIQQKVSHDAAVKTENVRMVGSAVNFAAGPTRQNLSNAGGSASKSGGSAGKYEPQLDQQFGNQWPSSAAGPRQDKPPQPSLVSGQAMGKAAGNVASTNSSGNALPLPAHPQVKLEKDAPGSGSSEKPRPRTHPQLSSDTPLGSYGAPYPGPQPTVPYPNSKPPPPSPVASTYTGPNPTNRNNSATSIHAKPSPAASSSWSSASPTAATPNVPSKRPLPGSTSVPAFWNTPAPQVTPGQRAPNPPPPTLPARLSAAPAPGPAPPSLQSPQQPPHPVPPPSSNGPVPLAASAAAGCPSPAVQSAAHEAAIKVEQLSKQLHDKEAALIEAERLIKEKDALLEKEKKSKEGVEGCLKINRDKLKQLETEKLRLQQTLATKEKEADARRAQFQSTVRVDREIDLLKQKLAHREGDLAEATQLKQELQDDLCKEMERRKAAEERFAALEAELERLKSAKAAESAAVGAVEPASPRIPQLAAPSAAAVVSAVGGGIAAVQNLGGSQRHPPAALASSSAAKTPPDRKSAGRASAGAVGGIDRTSKRRKLAPSLDMVDWPDDSDLVVVPSPSSTVHPAPETTTSPSRPPKPLPSVELPLPTATDRGPPPPNSDSCLPVAAAAPASSVPSPASPAALHAAAPSAPEFDGNPNCIPTAAHVTPQAPHPAPAADCTAATVTTTTTTSSSTASTCAPLSTAPKPSAELRRLFLREGDVGPSLMALMHPAPMPHSSEATCATSCLTPATDSLMFAAVCRVLNDQAPLSALLPPLFFCIASPQLHASLVAPALEVLDVLVCWSSECRAVVETSLTTACRGSAVDGDGDARLADAQAERLSQAGDGVEVNSGEGAAGSWLDCVVHALMWLARQHPVPVHSISRSLSLVAAFLWLLPDPPQQRHLYSMQELVQQGVVQSLVCQSVPQPLCRKLLNFTTTLLRFDALRACFFAMTSAAEPCAMLVAITRLLADAPLNPHQEEVEVWRSAMAVLGCVAHTHADAIALLLPTLQHEHPAPSSGDTCTDPDDHHLITRLVFLAHRLIAAVTALQRQPCISDGHLLPSSFEDPPSLPHDLLTLCVSAVHDAVHLLCALLPAVDVPVALADCRSTFIKLVAILTHADVDPQLAGLVDAAFFLKACFLPSPSC